MSLKLTGYTRVERTLEDLELSGDFVALSEELDRTADSGIFLPPAEHATIGKILKLAPGVKAFTGLEVGDRVLFTEWQGGRWAFIDPEARSGERKCLIINSDWLLAILKD